MTFIVIFFFSMAFVDGKFKEEKKSDLVMLTRLQHQ